MSEEKIFANGFSFKRHEKAPDFVVGNMSIKVDDAIAFLKEQKNEKGWVNLSVKTARSGNYYVELDTFQAKSTERPSQATTGTPAATTDAEGDDLPF